MFKFSRTSLERLATCDPRLQEIMLEVIKYVDVTIVCGHRGEEEQDEAYAKGLSKVKWPHGKHNSLPSKAIDVALYNKGKIDWKDEKQFAFLVGIIFVIAEQKNIKIRFGADFNGDLSFNNDGFLDLPHIELVD